MIGDMKQQPAAWGNLFEIKLQRLTGHQVNGDRVRTVGIEYQQIEQLTLSGQRKSCVTQDHARPAAALRQKSKETRIPGYAYHCRVNLKEGPLLSWTTVGDNRSCTQAHGSHKPLLGLFVENIEELA